MAVNIRKIFRLHCGPEARFIAYRMRNERAGSGGFPTICIGFSVGKRKFELDGVIHVGNSPDQRLENAVIKIACIAKDVHKVLAQPDGAGSVKIERQLQ